MKIKFYLADPLGKAFPPLPANSLIPEWYKKMDIEVSSKKHPGQVGNFSVKRCMPVLDYMSSGYIIRNIYDIVVKRSWDNQYGEDINLDFKFAGEISPIEFHAEDQMPIMYNGHKKKLCKFNGFWCAETPPGYSCLFYQPEYFNETRFKVFPGIVDTDEFNEPVSFPFIFSNTTNEEEYTIEAGTPLVCLMPFKRESWEHEILDYDKNNKTSVLMKTIWREPYRKLMHRKKSFK